MKNLVTRCVSAVIASLFVFAFVAIFGTAVHSKETGDAPAGLGAAVATYAHVDPGSGVKLDVTLYGKDSAGDDMTCPSGWLRSLWVGGGAAQPVRGCWMTKDNGVMMVWEDGDQHFVNRRIFKWASRT